MNGPIVGILLAAGRGRRFGGHKLLCPLSDGVPIALAAARTLRLACDRLLVVVRSGDAALSAVLGSEGFERVVCPAADAGMGHSLAAGVRASPDAGGWIVALADMPFIQAGSHLAVAARLRAGASLVATKFAGRRGHPVAFSARWRDPLSVLTGDHGARAILERHRGEIDFVVLDDAGVLRDIDRPEDLDPGQATREPGVPPGTAALAPGR